MSHPPRRVGREELADEDLQYYDSVLGRFHRTHAQGDETLSEAVMETGRNYWGRLMHSPEFGFMISEMGRVARSRGERGDSYSHVDREFVDQVLAVELDTNVVLGTHIPDGIALGIRFEAIEALRAGRPEDLTPRERMLASYIRSLVAGTVTPEQWNQIEAEMGERGVMDYTIFILWLQFTMRLGQAIGLPAISNDEVEQMLAELRSGERQLPSDTAARFS